MCADEFPKTWSHTCKKAQRLQVRDEGPVSAIRGTTLFDRRLNARSTHPLQPGLLIMVPTNSLPIVVQASSLLPKLPSDSVFLLTVEVSVPVYVLIKSHIIHA